MKNPFLFLVFIFCLMLYSCIINHPKPNACLIVCATIINITEGSTFDIVFQNSEGDRYYIIRGLEQGLNLEDLNASVLNKSVTLH